MKLQPLGFNVILKSLKEPEKTHGGIILTQQSQEATARAVVVAVGEGYLQPDNTLRPLRLQKGDTVIPSKYQATRINFDGDEYLIMSERDILAKIIEGDEDDTSN